MRSCATCHATDHRPRTCFAACTAMSSAATSTWTEVAPRGWTAGGKSGGRATPDPASSVSQENHRGSFRMQIAEITQLIGDLQKTVDSNPQAAAQKVTELKAKFASLPPDQQEQVRQQIEQLRSKASSLPPELQDQLRDIASTVRGAAGGVTR